MKNVSLSEALFLYLFSSKQDPGMVLKKAERNLVCQARNEHSKVFVIFVTFNVLLHINFRKLCSFGLMLELISYVSFLVIGLLYV